MPTVPQSEWPPQDKWPQPGWKHALNYERFRIGHVFAWREGDRMWTGIVEETGMCGVKVRDVLPGIMQNHRH